MKFSATVYQRSVRIDCEHAGGAGRDFFLIGGKS